MATRTFKITIDGDARGAVQAVDKTDRRLSQFQRDTDRSMTNLRGSISSTGRVWATAFGGAAVAVGVGLSVGMKKVIDSASNLNESMSKATTIFGKSANEIHQWAENSAEDFGLSKQAAYEAAGTFGNMFTQLDIGVGPASRMSRSMTELAGDFASFHNADITEVIEAQTAAFRGEYDGLQRFVPTINAASVEQRALADTGKRVNTELTAGEKAMAVYALMTEGAGKALGDFDRTSDGAANRSRILAAQFEDIRARLGDALMPMFIAVAGFVSDKVVPAFEKASDVVGAFIGAFRDPDITESGFLGQVEEMGIRAREVFDSIKADVSDFWSALTTGQPTTADTTWFEEIGVAAHDLAEIIAPFLRQKFDELITSLSTVISWIQKVPIEFYAAATTFAVVAIALEKLTDALDLIQAGVTALTPIIAAMSLPVAAVIVVVAALAAAFVFAYTRSEEFRDVVAGVVDWVQAVAIPWLGELWTTISQGAQDMWAAVQPVIAEVSGFFVTEFGKMRDWVREVWPQIQEAIGHAMVAIQVVVGAVLAVLMEAWRIWGDNLVTLVRQTWEFMQAFISAGMDILRGIIEFVLAIINGDWGRAWEAIVTILRGAWDMIWAVIEFALRLVVNLLNAALNIIQLGWSNAWNAVSEYLTGKWESIKMTVGNAVDWVATRLSDAWHAIGSRVTEAWESIAGSLSNTWDGIKRIASSVWDSIVGFVQSGVNRAIDIINGIGDAIEWVAEKLGLGITIPNVGHVGTFTRRGAVTTTGQQLASGGVPPFITDGPRAIVGEGNPRYPEFVIPTDPQYRGRAQMLWEKAGTQLMAAGGSIPGFLGGLSQVPGIGGAIGGALGGISSASEAVAKITEAARGISELPVPFTRNVVTWLRDKAISWARDKAESFLEQMASLVISPVGGGNPGSGRGARPRGPGIAGLYDPLASIVSRIVAESGGSVFVRSGWRSYASQVSLYRKYLNGTGNLAARPGTSKHERGAAVDFGGDLGTWRRLSAKYGLIFPVRGENWHAEYPGFARGGVIPFHNGGVLPEDIAGVGPSGQRYALEAGERVTRRGAPTGGVTIHMHEGAVQISVGRGATEEDGTRAGQAAAKAYLDTIAERRVLTTARIR